MKEQYVKPAMKIEVFSLSQTVADNCGASHTSFIGGPTSASKSSCGWRDEDGDICWLEKTSVCNIPTDADGTVNGWCYNAPSGGNQIFASY